MQCHDKRNNVIKEELNAHARTTVSGGSWVYGQFKHALQRSIPPSYPGSGGPVVSELSAQITSPSHLGIRFQMCIAVTRISLVISSGIPGLPFFRVFHYLTFAIESVIKFPNTKISIYFISILFRLLCDQELCPP